MQLRKIVIALLALLLAGAVMVPCVSAATDEIYDEKLQKWQDDHTIKITKTVNEKYSDGILTVDSTFTGKELTKRFGIGQFKRLEQIKVSPDVAEKMGLSGDKAVTTVTEESGVFTAEKDSPLATLSGYPVWLYAKDQGVYYQTGGPINLIWAGAYPSTIKSEFFEKGWYDGVWEEELYINDGGTWKTAYGIATSTTGVFGRDHVRLCQLYTGEVVGAAHSDSWILHEAIAIETTEDHVMTFFQDSDDTTWHVYPDNIYLGNPVSSPSNNGYATYIGYW